MPSPEKEMTLDDSNSVVLTIVSDGLQKAAEDATAKYGGDLFKQILPVAAASLAGPLAAGAAAIVSALIESTFKQTGVTDRKLDLLLAQPFKTATRTVREILSEEVKSDAEEAEATRRLQHAADQLEEAFSYAENALPKKRLLVRLYQLFVAALLEGGGAAMRKHESELLELASAAHGESRRLIVAAERAKNRQDGIVAEAMEVFRLSSRNFAPVMQRERTFPMGLPSNEQIQSFIDARVARYREDAARLEKNAFDVEALCALMEVVHQSRREILRAPKYKGFLKQIWERLLPAGGREV